MKLFASIAAVSCVLAASASAQTATTTLSMDEGGLQMAGPGEGTKDAPEQKKAYDKRVGGKVWLEATAGPSRFNATQFRSLDIIPPSVSQLVPRVVVTGPEFGAALRFRTGASTVGFRFKRADYQPFDLTSVGLDLGFLVRAVPYVHPSVRLGFNYYTTTGGLVIPGIERYITGVRSHGGGATIGAGLRIPIVRWISIAADFDYSIIGLVFRGTETVTGSGASVTAGTAGTAIAGTFSLTVHLGS